MNAHVNSRDIGQAMARAGYSDLDEVAGSLSEIRQLVDVIVVLLEAGASKRQLAAVAASIGKLAEGAEAQRERAAVVLHSAGMGPAH